MQVVIPFLNYSGLPVVSGLFEGILVLDNIGWSVRILGSISAALLSPVFVPPREETLQGSRAGSFPEQRLVMEPIRI